MSTSDPALLDTNILVYGDQALSPFHSKMFHEIVALTP